MLTFPFGQMTKRCSFFQNRHLLAEGEDAGRSLVHKQDYLRYNQDWSGEPLQFLPCLEKKISENRRKKNWRKNRINDRRIKFTEPNAIAAARTKIINFIFQIEIEERSYRRTPSANWSIRFTCLLILCHNVPTADVICFSAVLIARNYVW